MTIDEAIKLQETYLRNPFCNLRRDEKQANQLGIEALKNIKECRAWAPHLKPLLLPGETKD